MSIVWFRRDLRILDNPALHAAAALGPVLPVYILDEDTPSTRATSPRAMGAASRWWLHHSLLSLEASLGRLLLARGDPMEIIPQFVRSSGARAVFWNRCYEPQAIARDQLIKSQLLDAGIVVRSFNASLLCEPSEIATQTGGPFKVFTPFWRKHRQRDNGSPLPRPKFDTSDAPAPSVSLEALGLLPSHPHWAEGWDSLWCPGESGGLLRLDAFLDGGASGYAEGRDRPDLAHGSRLSAHLHFGEISPRQIKARLAMAVDRGGVDGRDAEKFLSELGWREFAYHLLYHFPQLPKRNWRAAFDAYPWCTDPAALRAWQRGLTGYPFVDAGMRELWATGTMHNRVRMVAASFLVKHLRIDWRLGEAWFWDTLVDADLANNAAGWQWVAGSGADAAPYFRIFNPVEQGRRFDPEGAYVRRWCPELAALATPRIHAPFEASASELRAAGIELGSTYPRPIVDHATARRLALAGYGAVKRAGA